MAQMGFTKFEDMIGRTDMLEAQEAIDHWKARGVDLTHLLAQPDCPPEWPRRRVRPQDPVLDDHLDHEIIRQAQAALERGERGAIEIDCQNKHRAIGGILSGEIARRYGEEGLPEDTIEVTLQRLGRARASARGSRRASRSRSGATPTTTPARACPAACMAVRPPEGAAFVAEENVIIGNTVLYGATSGKAFFRGLAGERFCVRNSGVHAVVEGVGDHGCEYMTGGRVVVLGPTGRNFAAGMSGGIAFVLDEEGAFPERCNPELVDLEEPTGRGLRGDPRARDGARRAHRRRRSPSASLAEWDELRGVLGEGLPARLQARAARGGRARPRSHRTGRWRRPSPAASRSRRSRRRASGARTAMGELGGFMKIHRVNGRKRPIPERVARLRGVHLPRRGPVLREQGARCMDCGIPFCHSGCPLGNLIPDWNDLVYRDRWPRGDRRAPRHEQLPRVHRPDLPGAVRGGVRARHQRRRRSRSSRSSSRSSTAPGRRAGSSPSRPPRAAASRSRSIGSGPAGLAAAAGAEPLRPQGHAVRAEHRTRAACCASACRTSSSRSGSCSGASTRWSRRASSSRLRRRRRARHHRRRAARAVRRDRASPSARRSRATCPVPGRELDGVHFAMDYLEMRNRWVGGEYPERHADHRRRQARGDHRRRRHRRGLPRQLAPRGARRRSRSSSCCPQPPDTRPEDLTPWPAVAADHAHLGRARGGRRARLQRDDHPLRGRGREGQAPARPSGGPAAVVREDRGLRVLDRLRPRAARDGLPHPQHEGVVEQLGRGRSTAAATWTRRADYMSSVPGVFAAGDARRGQSLIVWGSTRAASARARVDRWLHGMDAEDRGSGPRGGAGRGLTFSS